MAGMACEIHCDVETGIRFTSASQWLLPKGGRWSARTVGERVPFFVTRLPKTTATMVKKLKSDFGIFSFFAGAGFLDLGFEQSGFDVAYVNEVHKPFVKAYSFARKGLKIAEPQFGYDEGDIKRLLDKKEATGLQSKVRRAKQTYKLIGFIGGPPCPDFSVGGKNRGRDGENGVLSKVYTDLIVAQKPDFFLFENVKGLWRTKRHREFYEELKKKLMRAGYVLTERLINADRKSVV